MSAGTALRGKRWRYAGGGRGTVELGGKGPTSGLNALARAGSVRQKNSEKMKRGTRNRRGGGSGRRGGTVEKKKTCSTTGASPIVGSIFDSVAASSN